MATRRKLSTAPVAMTAGSSAAAIIVPESPLSPEDSTTVTPAVTAASLALASRLAEALPGRADEPNDSEMTSACSVATAASTPASTCDSRMTGVAGVLQVAQGGARGGAPL